MPCWSFKELKGNWKFHDVQSRWMRHQKGFPLHLHILTLTLSFLYILEKPFDSSLIISKILFNMFCEIQVFYKNYAKTKIAQNMTNYTFLISSWPSEFKFGIAQLLKVCNQEKLKIYKRLCKNLCKFLWKILQSGFLCQWEIQGMEKVFLRT